MLDGAAMPALTAADDDPAVTLATGGGVCFGGATTAALPAVTVTTGADTAGATLAPDTPAAGTTNGVCPDGPDGPDGVVDGAAGEEPQAEASMLAMINVHAERVIVNAPKFTSQRKRRLNPGRQCSL